MPTIDLTDAEHAEVTALIKRAIEEDHFPLSRRLDLLRSALTKLDPAAAAAIFLLLLAKLRAWDGGDDCAAFGRIVFR